MIPRGVERYIYPIAARTRLFDPIHARFHFLVISSAFGLLSTEADSWIALMAVHSDLLGAWNALLDSPGSCKVAVVKDPSCSKRGLSIQYLGIQPLESPIFR